MTDRTGPGRNLDIVVLAGANLLPLAGIAVLGWRAGDVLIGYWVETLAAGLWTLPKIATARGGPNRSRLAVIRLVAEFVLCYGVIAATLGWLLFLLFGQDAGARFLLGYFALFAAFLISHGVSYAGRWVADGERDRSGPGRPFGAAIGRLVLLYGAIVCIGSLLVYGWDAGALVAGAVALVALKTIADVGLRLLRLR